MRLHEINAKDTSKGSYAAVKFDKITIDALKAYQEENNIPSPLGADEMHATVMFSTKYIPDFEALGPELDWDGDFAGFDMFGDDDADKALVLKFTCSELQDRFDHIMTEYGASWDYDDFTPHITLSYDAGDVDIDSLPPFKGHITIVSEYGEDLELDWAADKK